LEIKYTEDEEPKKETKTKTAKSQKKQSKLSSEV